MPSSVRFDDAQGAADVAEDEEDEVQLDVAAADALEGAELMLVLADDIPGPSGRRPG